MKRILPLLLAVLLLFGCTSQEQPAQPVPPDSQEIIPAEPIGLYDPDSSLEAATEGAVQVFPLHMENVTQAIPLYDSLLILSGTDSTTVTRLTGDTLVPEKSFTLELPALQNSPAFSASDKGLSFYDQTVGQIVLLDTSLREFRRIDVPDGLQGLPILSEDWSRVFYCTDNSLQVLELDTGISRMLKEMRYPTQEVTGTLLEDTIAQITICDADGIRKSLFISTETGQLLGEYEGHLTITSYADRYYGHFAGDGYGSAIFGTLGQEPQVLVPDDLTFLCSYLEEEFAAVTITSGEAESRLDYYDLSTGMRTASICLPFTPYGISGREGDIWFLAYDEAQGCDILCRWDTGATPLGDTRDYTRIHFTQEEPDYEGLALCSLSAQEISAKYGIDVLIYKDAVALQPWDYDMEPEYRVPILQRELALLDQRLANYPEGFLQTIAGQFTGLKICLVKELTGSAESGSLDIANGIQFWEGHTAYLALSTEFDTEYTLYHELCHLIDTIVLNESIAYDQWDKLNPTGFEYDNDYILNREREDSTWLTGSSRCFIDTYSMSYPKEDRARIMEYAMTSGNEGYFQSLAMQSKLLTLCQGIRDAFGLTKSPETFLWEQYLNTSLAYTEG